jgi:chromosome partitioning protein
MAKVTAVANVKGGVGKTSLVMNLGHVLAQSNRRVLLIDTDVQGALADWLGTTPQATLADVLEERAEPRAAITPARPQLDVVASGGADLRHSIRTLLGMAPRRKVNPIFRRMDRFITAVDARYDVILIDCAPSLDFIAEAIYPSIDDVVIPTSMTAPSVKNMEIQLDTLEEMQQAGYRVDLNLIVPTLVRADDARQRQWLQQLAESYPGLVAEPIHYDPAVEYQSMLQQTVLEATPQGQVAQDYRLLAEAYLRRPSQD